MAGLRGGITYFLNAIHRSSCCVVLRSICVSSKRSRGSNYRGFVPVCRGTKLRGQEVLLLVAASFWTDEASAPPISIRVVAQGSRLPKTVTGPSCVAVGTPLNTIYRILLGIPSLHELLLQSPKCHVTILHPSINYCCGNIYENVGRSRPGEFGPWTPNRCGFQALEPRHQRPAAKDARKQIPQDASQDPTQR